MKKLFKKIDNFIFRRYNNKFLEILEAEVKDSISFLDIGCGKNSYIEHINMRFKYSVGVDGFLPSLDNLKKNNVYTDYVHANIESIDKKFPQNSSTN